MVLFDCDTLFGPWPEDVSDTSLDFLLQQMERLGVARALTASTLGVFHEHLCGNEATLEACAADGRILPMATLNPLGSANPRREVAAMREAGFRALRLYNEYQEWLLDMASMPEILEAAGNEGLPVLLNCSARGAPSALLRSMPPNEAAPQLKVVMLDVRYFNMAEAFSIMRSDPRLLLSVKNVIMPDSVELCVRTAGAERLVMASSAPLDYMLPAVIRVEKARVSDEDKEKILWSNAQSLI